MNRSYLATDKNIELNRLREEQEQKEDAEAEQGYAWERAQRREPLADLSKETTGCIDFSYLVFVYVCFCI